MAQSIEACAHYLALKRKPEPETAPTKVDNRACREAAAHQGDAQAQAQLGFSYEHGRNGLPKDEREAARLYKLAADQGDAWAQAQLGFFHAQGRGGLPKDEHEAARLYKLAADQGDSTAQSNLGVYYKHGEAPPLYKLAAEQGNATAQNNLGSLYEQGQGVAQDCAAALSWYRKAADQGGIAPTTVELGKEALPTLSR